MKALGIAKRDDLHVLGDYMSVADQLLLDAKAPDASELPGGNGIAFDWQLLAQQRFSIPWMLAGGLRVENVATAIEQTGARQVDVSSGVETAPGVKSAQKIRAFIAQAQSANRSKPPRLK